MAVNVMIKERLEQRGWSRKQLAAKVGYSKSSIDKAMAGIGSPAVMQAMAKALGLATPDDAASPAVEGNGRVRDPDDAPPVLRAGSIVGGATESGALVGQADVVLPGALVLMARERKLPFDQVITLARVLDVLMGNGGTSSFGIPKSEWDDLYRALESWL